MLEERLMFFNTGMTRDASSILKHQTHNLYMHKSTNDKTTKLVQMAETSIKYLENGNLDDFGDLLDAAWQIKKNIASGVTDPRIDGMYSAAMRCGALGGKILGAGGGGYLMMYVPLDKQDEVRHAMGHFKEMKVKFTDEGSKAQIV
jgi:D-glycero-alpha-D-manno-heptose-7-phosphate kinase